MDNNSTNNYHTPSATIYGALLITAGSFTGMIALGEKMSAVLIVGAIITAIGIVFVLIGKNQKKRLQEQAGTSTTESK